MSQDRYRVEILARRHDRSHFSCGVEALDRYFQQQAGQDFRRKMAVTYVLFDVEQELVVGYYTLSSSAIVPDDLPADLARKLPNYPRYPAVLLGRLAVDLRYRSQGFGELLLLDALQRAFAHSEGIAAMAVIVDAMDAGARRFYERYGFETFPHDQQRLFLPIQRIAPL